jgi:hypothetical protein
MKMLCQRRDSYEFVANKEDHLGACVLYGFYLSRREGNVRTYTYLPRALRTTHEADRNRLF